MDSLETILWIQLLNATGIGVGLFQRLLERFGDPREVFEASAKDLAAVPGISTRLAGSIAAAANARSREEAEREMERAGRAGVVIRTFNDPAYPESLRTIPGPPPYLYVRGDPDCLAGDCVAMVGTRRATSHGLRSGEALAAELAAAGVTVVSGLAQGIDSACHEGALRAGGRTAAVLGNGLGFALPKERQALLERIVERGAVLSEFPMEMSPRPENFPRRNRIISGLAAAAVVVEAGEGSGALITASFAADQGREVLAVPGRMTDVQSAGCNLLIREGAGVVQSAADILEAIAPKGARGPLGRSPAGGPGTAGAPPVEKGPPPTLNEDEAKVFGILAGDSRHVDEITRETGFAPYRVAQILLALELKGAVVRESGMRYARS